jgi:[acyl-carrier-protein] S-malonyltransferase
MKAVFMFPGQSSRYDGMLGHLVGSSAGSRELVDRASDLLGRDLLAFYGPDTPEPYGRNRDIQIAVFLANQIMLDRLEAAGVEAVGSLGLSLGEWNHLVHIGALSFDEALLAVERRGHEYDGGPRGTMAAVFPVELDELAALIEPLRARGVIEVAVLNSPRSHVVAGERALVAAAVELLEDELFLQPVMIERQVPMHSSLFEPVGARFAEYLRDLPFRRPRLPYLPNRVASLLPDPDHETFVTLLSRHVHEPVRWRESVECVRATWPEAALVEVGPRKVLCNLLDRRWQPGVTKLHTDSETELSARIGQVAAELHRE